MTNYDICYHYIISEQAGYLCWKVIKAKKGQNGSIDLPDLKETHTYIFFCLGIKPSELLLFKVTNVKEPKKAKRRLKPFSLQPPSL